VEEIQKTNTGVEKRKKKKSSVRKTPESSLKERSYYQKQLKKDLPENFFEKDPYRVCWTICLFSLSSMGFMALMTFKLEMFPKIVLGVLVGYVNTLLYHTLHELMHGSVLGKKNLEDAIGLVGYLPLLVSPTMWRYWHNEMHHERTQQGRLDPLCWPTLDEYQNSTTWQRLFPYTPGSGFKRSYVSLFFFFFYQVQSFQWYGRFKRSEISTATNWRISFEMLFQYSVVGFFMYLAGIENFFFCTVIPFLVHNFLISLHMLKQNSLMPMTEVNDPLANTVSTKAVAPILAYYDVHHVEHSIYPEVPFFRLRNVKNQLKQKYKTQYKELSVWKSFQLLFRAPKVYKNNEEFINPLTKKTYSKVL
jgi:fatty acid desaturase